MKLYELIATKNECYKVGKSHKIKGIMVHSTAVNNPWLSRYVGPNDGKLGENRYNNHFNNYHPGGKDVEDHTYVNKNNDGVCDICGGRQVCVHAFIGKLADGTIATYQILPWSMAAWHSGTGSKGNAANANNTGYIGFEICEDSTNDKSYFDKVYKEAVELCAHLCKENNLNPLADGVIICHSEGHKRGIASNHGDVMHWFPKHGKSMDTFRKDVNTLLGNSTVKESTTITDNKSETTPTNRNRTFDDIEVGDILYFKGKTEYDNANAKNGVSAKPSKVKVTRKYLSSSRHPIHVRAINDSGKFIGGVYGWVDLKDLTTIEYKVKVTADALNYRKGPGVSHSVAGTIIDKGVYSIIDEKNGWGLLKSKVGWINLNYTKKF